MKVGFIGLGRMGAGMAARLLRAGHDVTVYNRTARRVADVCRGDAVITMLADDGAVENVVFGDGGLLHNLVKGSVHVSMSTISVALSERLTAAHASAGQHLVASPVFGRPDAAAAGKLFIIAAGAADTVQTCMPLFEALGQKTVRAGTEPKAANVIKLSGNFLIASVIEALGEAMALASKAGIDRHHYVEMLTSTLFTGPLFTNYGALLAEQKFQPAGFAVPLGAKDIRLTLAAAETLRVPMPLGSLLHDRFVRLLAQGGEELDWSAIGQLAAADAALPR
jgi:3-hydroxyisobutyrate dehydrogenase-like beta-hydroxyacid dehydrogenase